MNFLPVLAKKSLNPLSLLTVLRMIIKLTMRALNLT